MAVFTKQSGASFSVPWKKHIPILLPAQGEERQHPLPTKYAFACALDMSVQVKKRWTSSQSCDLCLSVSSVLHSLH